MTTSTDQSPAFEVEAVHHLGVTVRSVDDALAFWEGFLGIAPLWRRRLDGDYLAAITGYPGLVLDACVIELAGGVVLELLDYQVADKASNDMATASPGNVHIAVKVSDVDAAWRRAVDCGASPVSEGPVEITGGPNVGGRACYLRAHDGVTLELVQSQPGS